MQSLLNIDVVAVLRQHHGDQHHHNTLAQHYTNLEYIINLQQTYTSSIGTTSLLYFA